MATTHSMTVRLPDAVYRSARRLAEREGVSLNRLVAESLAERARQSTSRRLKSAYDELGRDKVESDVERFVGVQAEALLDG
jgi:predicted transcriptional regulator